MKFYAILLHRIAQKILFANGFPGEKTARETVALKKDALA